jgi:hypothetical protein
LACTGTYVEVSFPIINKRPTTNPIRIQTADGGIIEAELNMPMLNAQARHVHVVPGLKGCSLLSIACLCDSGYEVIFHRNYMQILRQTNAF